MEWVIVRFPRSCDVFIDGERVGPTNRILTIEAGPHVFDLGSAGGYRPLQITRTVVDTGPEDPAVIKFREA